MTAGTHGGPPRVREPRRGGAPRVPGSRGAGPRQPGDGPRPGGRRAPRRPAGPLRLTRRGKWVLAITVSLVVLLVAAAGAVWIELNGNISTFDAGGESKYRPPAGRAGQNILLLGSDSRSGSNHDYAGGTGAVGRSDTAILLHVFADHRHALGVSIPRDSLVTIPPCLLPDGTWSPTRYDTPFNAAFSMGETVRGNPACTQNTVEKLTGLRVDHTIVVDFAGFAAMTSAVGGVPVCVPQDVRQGDIDPHLGYPGRLVFAKGLQTVSGRRALDYVRMRHGMGDGSDIGRTQRQQAFVAAMIKKVRAQGFDVTTLLPLANAATESLTVDPGLDSATKLVSFGLSLKDIDLKNIEFVTAPWRYQGEKVALVHPDADQLWAALKADRTLSGENAGGRPGASAATAPASAAPTAVDGAGIAVAVWNGTTTQGLAARAAAALTGDGFTVTGTATAAAQTHDTTLVEFGAAHRTGAETLARLFPGARLVPTSADGINLVLGRDYAAGATGPGSAAATAATAAPATGLPKADAGNARTAAEDPCRDLTYGSGG